LLILTINAGSSSLRLNLFEQTGDGIKRLAEVHHAGIDRMDMSLLTDFVETIDLFEIKLIVHRVVHGGTMLTTPRLINTDVETEIERLISLAPLHNPASLAWIRFARRLLGFQIPQIAVFDTSFYHALPEVASIYALPHELYRLHGIRRYGFHGIAHQAMWQRWRELRPELKDGGLVITVQLGSGCSITAIDHGKPMDTSMGFSPLEGLVMATRSGDIDPSVVTYLQKETGWNVEDIETMLNKRSGLLGLSGESEDMRELLISNSPEAELAINLYCYRVRKYIGAYLAVLGGSNAILLGGGVGENSPQVRAKILQGMRWMGIDLDEHKNNSAVGVEATISSTNSTSELWVISVDEASIMAREALMFS
jgi:acetate kinase